MEKKLKVAQIIGSVFEGGVESCVMNYFLALDKSKVETTFVIDRFSKLINKESIEKMGGKVALVPHYTHVFAYRRALEKLFKEEHFDVVHANMSTLNFIPLKAAKKAHIPARIAHGHATSSPDEKIRNIVKNVLRPFSGLYATALAACSNSCGNWLFRGKHDFTVIPNAINFKRFEFNAEKREEIRKKLNLSDSFVIGNVGRFVSVKNHMFMLSVFKEILKTEKNAKLLLVGSGELFEDIMQKARELKVDDKTIFAGSVADPESYLMAMDCFIFPSFYEGLGLATVEAQASGLRCFVSDHVSSEAKISENIEYLPLGDAALWAQEILKPGTKERKIAVAEKYFKLFDINYQADNLIKFYMECSK